MQYILTQKELDYLTEQIATAKDENRELILDLCTQVCDLKPILFWGRPEPKPWGCIHSSSVEWFCDECPVQKVCPEEHKEWSQ